MKFIREKKEDLENPGAVRLVARVVEPEGCDFKIVSTSSGVTMSGTSPLFADNNALQVFAQALGTAMDDYLKLKRTVRSKLQMQ